MNKKTLTDETLWKELVEHHVLDAEKVDSFRSQIDEMPWMPLGKVLIRQGFVTVRQVMALLSIQAIEPHLRIGDLAVREGVCTPEQVLTALEIQARACPGPIEILARDERIDNGDIINALVGYIRHLEGHVDSLSRGITEAELPCLH